MQLHILWWACLILERKHRSLWPIFYVDMATNRNIPPKNCILFIPLYAFYTNMNRTLTSPYRHVVCFDLITFRNKEYAIPHSVYRYVYRTVLWVWELNLKTSYLFDINCHFRAIYVAIFSAALNFPLKCSWFILFLFCVTVTKTAFFKNNCSEFSTSNWSFHVVLLFSFHSYTVYHRICLLW